MTLPGAVAVLAVGLYAAYSSTKSNPNLAVADADTACIMGRTTIITDSRCAVRRIVDAPSGWDFGPKSRSLIIHLNMGHRWSSIRLIIVYQCTSPHHCSTMYCTVLQHYVLYCTVALYTVLYCSNRYCNVLQYYILYSTVVLYTVQYFSTIYCTVQQHHALQNYTLKMTLYIIENTYRRSKCYCSKFVRYD